MSRRARILPRLLPFLMALSLPGWAEEPTIGPAERNYEEWKERQAEAERRRKAEAEQEQRQAEAERRRKAEAGQEQRQAEAERRRQAEAAKERRRRARQDREAEQERQAEAERRRQAEDARERQAETEAEKERRDEAKRMEAERLLAKKEAERQTKERGLEALEQAEGQFAANPAAAFAALEAAASLENPLAKAMLAIWGDALAQPGTAEGKADTWLDALTTDDIRQLRWMAKQQNDILAQLVLGQLFALALVDADPKKDPPDPAEHLFAYALDNDDHMPLNFLLRLCRLNAGDTRPGAQQLAEFCQARTAPPAAPPPSSQPVPISGAESQIPRPPPPAAEARRAPVIEPAIAPLAPAPSNPQAAGFGLAKYELSFAEWDACVAADGCPPIRDSGFGRGNRPAINVSWQDAQTYILWLNKATGKHYRLPTGAEWDYAALAGAAGFPQNRCGPAAGANYDDRNNPCGVFRQPLAYQGKTAPVGRYRPNAFGLHDMAGNVREWVADCADTSPQAARCAVRGGSWGDGDPYRSPVAAMPADRANPQTGFRLVLDTPH